VKILKDKNILVISPEAWGKSMLSKHHYAIELTKTGNRVWFLQPQRYQSTKDLIVPPNIYLLEDRYTVAGMRFLPKFIRKTLFRNRIRKMQRDAHCKFDFIWNFDNSRFFDLDCFMGAFTIHHRMDYHYDYQNERASASANVCFGVTAEIVKSMKEFNPHSYFIQHGHAEIQKREYPLPNPTAKTKALYVGNLLIPYINWDWIHALVSSQPEVNFLFAGSSGKGNLNNEINQQSLREVEKLRLQPHVTLLGEISPSEIRSIFDQVDILFAAYDVEKHPKILANSHKIMEYLGSGKPIICNTMTEYSGRQDLLYMASTLTEFMSRFEWIRLNLAEATSQELTTKRQVFASENSYANQVKRIDDILYSLKK
jgi:glycosyltransferase involved in cell wall biosynthesis